MDLTALIRDLAAALPETVDVDDKVGGQLDMYPPVRVIAETKHRRYGVTGVRVGNEDTVVIQLEWFDD